MTTFAPPFSTIGIPADEVVDALISGVVVIKRRVEIYENDAVTPFAITDWDSRVIDGSITVDGTRDERRMCDFSFQNNDLALKINADGGFFYDKILKAFWGIEYYSGNTLTHWEMQVGEFMIDRIVEDYFPNVCKVTGRDYAKKCLLSKIKNSLQFSSGTPVEQIISALAANSGVTKFRMPYTGIAFTDNLVFDAGTPRFEMMKKLAGSVGYEVYFTSDGYLTMRPWQDPVLSPVSWIFRTGVVDGTLVTYTRTSDDALIRNHVIVQGATVTNDVGFSITAYGEAFNTDSNSPTRIDKIGDRVDFYKSDFITDPEQAQIVAEQRLRVSALEEYSIDFSSVILPWIDANDIVDIINDKEIGYVPARFLLSNYTLPFSLSSMSGNGKRVTIVGTSKSPGVS
jgi:hypothetical protein